MQQAGLHAAGSVVSMLPVWRQLLPDCMLNCRSGPLAWGLAGRTQERFMQHTSPLQLGIYITTTGLVCSTLLYYHRACLLYSLCTVLVL